MRNNLLTAILAVTLIAVSAGVADAASIKPSTSAQASGRCISTVMLFSRMSENTLGKKTPIYDEMITAWATHISGKDQAFQDAAKAESKVTLKGFSAAKEKGGADGLFAEVTGNLAKCLEYQDS